MKISALIQVRMKSERLPGKALLKIDGIAVIEHVISNLKLSKYIDDIIICTTKGKEDDLLEEFAKINNISIFRGDVDNVIKRFYDSARKYNTDIIVRIAGDCPIVSCEAADLLIKSHIETGADYTSIEANVTPIGSFPQVISYNALEKLTQYDLDFNLSEYMIYYFTNNPNYFTINIVPAPPAYKHPEFRLTLDYEEDLKMFNRLFMKIREANMKLNLRNILFILNKYPDISHINEHLVEKYKNIYDELMDNIKRATTINTSL